MRKVLKLAAVVVFAVAFAVPAFAQEPMPEFHEGFEEGIGGCNEYWTENGFPDGSGPFRPFGEFSESWPSTSSWSGTARPSSPRT